MANMFEMKHLRFPIPSWVTVVTDAQPEVRSISLPPPSPSQKKHEQL